MGAVQFSPALSTIAQTIQLSLSPVFMLAGIAAVMNVIAGRLGRVIDRARALEELHGPITAAEHARHLWELRLLDRRMKLTNAALLLAVTSAAVTCVTVGMMFVGELAKLHLGRYVAAAFVLSMALLISALLSFLAEVQVSLRANRVPRELLRSP